MRELREKHKRRERLYSTPVLIIVLVVSLFIARGAYGVMKKENESARHVEVLVEKVAELEARKGELRQNIEKLETEKGIEEEIKEKFSVSREGERVVVIVDQEETATASATSTVSWYERFLNIFKGSSR